MITAINTIWLCLGIIAGGICYADFKRLNFVPWPLVLIVMAAGPIGLLVAFFAADRPYGFWNK